MKIKLTNLDRKQRRQLKDHIPTRQLKPRSSAELKQVGDNQEDKFVETKSLAGVIMHGSNNRIEKRESETDGGVTPPQRVIIKTCACGKLHEHAKGKSACNHSHCGVKDNVLPRTQEQESRGSMDVGEDLGESPNGDTMVTWLCGRPINVHPNIGSSFKTFEFGKSVERKRIIEIIDKYFPERDYPFHNSELKRRIEPIKKKK